MSSGDQGDRDWDRVKTKVDRARARAVQNGSSRVRRPSAGRVLPAIAVCLGPIAIGLFTPVPLIVSLVCFLAVVPVFLLVAELCTHRVIISATSVTDHTWRGESTNDGSSDSYTVLDRPNSLLRVRRKARPMVISWTDTEDSVHALSFMWFSARAAIDIIAGVHALDD